MRNTRTPRTSLISPEIGAALLVFLILNANHESTKVRKHEIDQMFC